MKKLIVIEGPVGAGKTTLFQNLQRTLKNDPNTHFVAEPNLEKVTLNGKDYNILNKIYQSPFRAERYLCSEMVICRLLADTYLREGERTEETLIMDRWIMSCKLFLEITYRKKLIGEFSRDFMTHFLTGEHKKFEEKIKGRKIYKFYLDTDAETCLERIKMRGREDELGLSDPMWLEHHHDFNQIAKKSKYYFSGNQNEIKKEILTLVTRK